MASTIFTGSHIFTRPPYLLSLVGAIYMQHVSLSTLTQELNYAKVPFNGSSSCYSPRRVHTMLAPQLTLELPQRLLSSLTIILGPRSFGLRPGTYILAGLLLVSVRVTVGHNTATFVQQMFEWQATSRDWWSNTQSTVLK